MQNISNRSHLRRWQVFVESGLWSNLSSKWVHLHWGRTKGESEFDGKDQKTNECAGQNSEEDGTI